MNKNKFITSLLYSAKINEVGSHFAAENYFRANNSILAESRLS